MLSHCVLYRKLIWYCTSTILRLKKINQENCLVVDICCSLASQWVKWGVCSLKYSCTLNVVIDKKFMGEMEPVHKYSNWSKRLSHCLLINEGKSYKKNVFLSSLAFSLLTQLEKFLFIALSYVNLRDHFISSSGSISRRN